MALRESRPLRPAWRMSDEVMRSLLAPALLGLILVACQVAPATLRITVANSTTSELALTIRDATGEELQSAPACGTVVLDFSPQEEWTLLVDGVAVYDAVHAETGRISAVGVEVAPDGSVNVVTPPLSSLAPPSC